MGVYKFAYDEGIPHSSCQQFTGVSPISTKCTDIDLCMDCAYDGTCHAVDYKKYYASNYYSLPKNDTEQLKAEIYLHGPISCSMNRTAAIETFFDDIDNAQAVYEEYNPNTGHNHCISVVGWGLDEATGNEYWIVRTAIGSYWGDYGFFRIRMDLDYSLGIGRWC